MARLNRRIAPLTLGLLAAGLTACADSQPWVWDTTGQPPAYAYGATPRSPGATDEPGHEPSVVVFGGPAFDDPYAQIGDRRDGLLAARTADVTGNRLAWPEPDRPSLDRTRTVRTSSSPDRWYYPSTTNGRRNRGGSWGGSGHGSSGAYLGSWGSP